MHRTSLLQHWRFCSPKITFCSKWWSTLRSGSWPQGVVVFSVLVTGGPWGMHPPPPLGENLKMYFKIYAIWWYLRLKDQVVHKTDTHTQSCMQMHLVEPGTLILPTESSTLSCRTLYEVHSHFSAGFSSHLRKTNRLCSRLKSFFYRQLLHVDYDKDGNAWN